MKFKHSKEWFGNAKRIEKWSRDAIEKEEETSIKHQVQETDDGSSNIRLTSKILTSTSLENEQKHLLEEGKEYENAMLK